MNSAASASDVITVDTEGIWWLMAAATLGNINIGDMVFIDWWTAVVSDDWQACPFGHALAQVLDGQTTLIAVKVHAFQVIFPWWLFP